MGKWMSKSTSHLLEETYITLNGSKLITSPNCWSRTVPWGTWRQTSTGWEFPKDLIQDVWVPWVRKWRLTKRLSGLRSPSMTNLSLFPWDLSQEIIARLGNRSTTSGNYVDALKGKTKLTQRLRNHERNIGRSILRGMQTSMSSLRHGHRRWRFHLHMIGSDAWKAFSGNPSSNGIACVSCK